MITVTPLEILNAMNPQAGQEVAPLDRLAQVAEPEAAWRVSYAVEALTDAVGHFRQIEQRLAQRYGELQEDGAYRFEGEAQTEFRARHDRLLAYQLELEIERLPRSYAELAGLSAADLLALRFLIEREPVDRPDPFVDWEDNP